MKDLKKKRLGTNYLNSYFDIGTSSLGLTFHETWSFIGLKEVLD